MATPSKHTAPEDFSLTHSLREEQFVSSFSCFREVNCVTVGGDTFLAGGFSLV